MFSNFFDHFETDDDFLFSIKRNLVDTLRYDDLFSDIILFRNHDDYVVSIKKHGFRLDSFYSEYTDVREILNLDDFTTPFFMLINSGTAEEEDNSLYYVFPKLKNGMRSQIMTGFAAFVLYDPALIFDTSLQNINSEGVFVVMNQTGILYSSNDNSYTYDFFTSLINDEELSPASNSIFSDNYYFTYSTIEDNSVYPLTYVYYEPTYSFFHFMKTGSDELSLMLYIFIFTAITFTFFINLYLFKRNPVTYALKTVSSSPTSETDKRLFEALSAPAHIASNSGNLLELNTFSSLLGSTPEKYFAGIYVEFSTGVEGFATLDSYLNTFNLKHYIKTISSRHVLCVLNYSETRNNLRVISQGLSQSLINSLPPDILFNVYYTYYTDNLDELTSNMEYIINCRKYSYIYGYHNTFSQHHLSSCENSSDVLEPRVDAVTKQYFIERKTSDFKNYLLEKKKLATSSPISFNAVIAFYDSVIYAIKNYFIETKIDHPIINFSDSLRKENFKNIDDLIAYISAIADFYDEYVSNESSFANRRIIENIISYVENNIEEITLAATAEHFNITSPHLSRTFKEATGINFSDFVSEKKLTKAAWLLENDSSLTIAEISHRMGYNTPTYFSQKFKVRFGVTPAAYRKRSIN